MNMPNIFLVGAAKSGTTTLYNYLNHHPSIFMCPIKEPHHFSKDIDINNFRNDYRKNVEIDIKEYLNNVKLNKLHIAYIKNRNNYLELYREVSDETIVGECSTGYLYSTNAAKEIYDFNPNAKIIVILRNPIERAFSHWLMGLQIGLIQNSDFLNEVFDDYNSEKKGWGITNLYIELGLYYDQVKRYYDIFPKKNIKVYLFEELKSNSLLKKDLYNFLGLEMISQNTKLKKYNETLLPKNILVSLLVKNRKLKSFLSKVLTKQLKNKLKSKLYSKDNIPKLTDDIRKQLMPFFKDDIIKLEQLINKDLSHWYGASR